MSNFPFVLATAILILAALFVLYGDVFVKPEVQKITYTTISEEEIEAPIIIRYPEEEVKHVSIAKNFSVGSSFSKVLVELNNITVSRGLFSSIDRKVLFEANPETIESAKIVYTVNNTNLYGSLLFVINKNIVFNNYSLIGSHEVEFNKSILNKENILEIYAESSGWKMWAPTVYILDLKVIAETLSREKSYNFYFSVKGDITGARIVVSSEGYGNLTMKVNDVEIFKNIPKSVEMIDFSPKILKENNTIYFSTDGEYNIREAELIIFYQPEYRPKIFWYNITQSQYNELSNKNVTLRFYVERLSGGVTSLSIKITDAIGRIHNILFQGILREGRFYSVELTKNELAPGSNKIEFSVDKGGILITNITVG